MTNEKYKIREICGDWALDIPFPGSVFTIFFNSRLNAELVKTILIHEDAHPNEAVPFNPCTYTPANIDRKAWEPCECCRSAKFMNGQYMYNFCPSCGRPLTDEAWGNLEKQLEGV